MRKHRQRKDYGLKQDERGVWHCDFSVAGERYQRSTFTQVRAEAEEWCADLAQRAWREIKLGEKPSLPWETAVAIWFKDKEQDGKKDLANDEDKKIVLAPLLDGKMIHAMHIDPEARQGSNLLEVLDGLQLERGLANATRNRYASFINGVLNHVRGKGYKAPALKLAKRKEQRQESRALTQHTGEAERLFAELPLHLRRPGRFSLACGHRQANVTGLRWFQERYARNGSMLPHVTHDLRHMVVPSSEFKSTRVMRIPLNDEAVAILRDARDCDRHGHKSFVFTSHGRPIAMPYNSAFKKAVKRAKLDGFTWHGFRHTWTTWHLENGTPVEVVQKLGGWSSIQILLKHYAHLLDRHVAKFAGNVTVPAVEQPMVEARAA
jgi:integrase